MTISDKIYKEKEKWSGSVTLKNGIVHNHHEILKRIERYSHSQYFERNDDAIFLNICSPRAVHFAKNIDLDTKDLQPYGIGEVNFVKVWILRMKFYAWLRERKMALKLNDLAEGLADYGSLVWKKVEKDDGVDYEECTLSNLYFDPLAKTISDVPVIEVHELSLTDLIDKKDAWDNVDEVIKIVKENKEEKVEILERWGKWEEDGKVTDRHFIVYGQGNDEVILLDEEDDAHPYRDFHVHRYMGTWLRVGVYQRLFRHQERMNQLINQNAQATEIASLLLLRTADGEVRGNVLTQAENGMIINSTDLQQIALQNPGLTNFVREYEMINAEADKLCLTPEVVTGEAMPSGTPFRSLATLSNAAKSAFRIIQQNIGEKIGYLLIDEVFPSVMKEWNKESIFELPADENDVRMYDKILMDKMENKYIKDSMFAGMMPNQNVINQIPSMVENEVEMVGRRMSIPKGFFDFKFGIRVNVTGESIDKSQQNDAMFNALQMASANPGLVNTPLFRQYLENNGISYWKLTPDQMETLQPAQMSGQPMQGKQDKLMAQVNS